MSSDPPGPSQIAVTTDVVLYAELDAEPCVLLVRRAHYPYQGSWAFPGGFVETDEDLVESARRELAEETGIVVEDLRQLGAYGAPGRDPRMRVVTVVFWTEVDPSTEHKAGDDAAETRFWPVAGLLANPELLAFDHFRILQDTLSVIGASR